MMHNCKMPFIIMCYINLASYFRVNILELHFEKLFEQCIITVPTVVVGFHTLRRHLNYSMYSISSRYCQPTVRCSSTCHFLSMYETISSKMTYTSFLQLLTVVLWATQTMAKLLTLGRQHLDGKLPTDVKQAFI